MALRGRVDALRAPEPDGQAAVCKTAEAGSTPAGAFHRPLPRSPLFGTGSFSRLILMIKEAFSDDVIGLPSKVDGPALPGAKEWNAVSFERRQSVVRSGRRHPLADHDSSRPGPCVEHRRVRRLAAMVGGAWCIRRTNGYEWPSERKGLGRRDARAAVACTVPTTREHRGAAPITYQSRITTGSAYAVLATHAEGHSRPPIPAADSRSWPAADSRS